MTLRAMLWRILTGALQLVVLLILVFFLIRLLPADPVARFVGLNASPEAYHAAQVNLGLDRPLLQQFAGFLGLQAGQPGLLQGSLGRSWVSGDSVGLELAEALPVTLELITLGFLVALLVAIPVGVWGALRPGGPADKATLVYSLFAGSQPEFVWGLLFIFVFFQQLGLAPGPLGRLSPLTTPPPVLTGMMIPDSLLAGRADLAWEAARYLMLPVATLAFVLSGPLIKMIRESMALTLATDYILYARAVGLSPGRIAANALRAAFAPCLSLIAILYGFMLGGAVLVESVFSLPGLGQYAIRAVLAFDYPAIQGVVLAISAISLLVYLLLDLLHAALDPRVTL
jgi:ABC-type dipeptide/oligopeptide/nickel transport system permease component